MPPSEDSVGIGVINGPNNEFCWCTNLATGTRVLSIVSVLIRCILFTMYCLSEESQSGFNYYHDEWRGTFSSLDLAVIILFFFAVMADISLAKWSTSRSKLTTLVAVLCWLLVNVIAILFQAVILFGLLFGGSRNVDLTVAEYQVMLSVLGICLAFNLYCALVIAHWRKNICEEMQIANTPFQALAWLSPTEHQRRDGGSPFGMSDDPPSAPPPASPPPTYAEATKMPAASSSSETVKINMYTDDPDGAAGTAAAASSKRTSAAQRADDHDQLPPDYEDVVSGQSTHQSGVL